MKTEKGFAELDFFVRYLRNHLTEHHFDKENTQKFIEARADEALYTYVAEFSSGRPPFICQELAMRTLLNGLYVSRYDVVYHILEEDCWLRISSEVCEPTALHIQNNEKVIAILNKYAVNGDFLDKEEYPALHYELLGVISEILDEYGL